MERQLTTLQKNLVNHWQRGFPLVERPFLEIAEREGVLEREVIEAFEQLKELGVLSRLGATYRTGWAGASALAALSVAPERLEEVAAIVNGFEGVNHNYEREGDPNLWFVVTAPDQEKLEAMVTAIEAQTGCEVLVMPMVESYRLDLGFEVS